MRFAPRAVVAAAVLVAASGVGAFAVACDSFSEGGDTTPAPDASDEAPSTDAPVGDVTSSDGGATCVPEAIEPFDAGPEDAGCGPNGAAVQLAIDPAHCGFCGNACGDGTCDQGACSAPSVGGGDSEVIVSNAVRPAGLLFVTNESNCNAAHFRALGFGPDAGPFEVLNVDGGCVSSLALHDEKLYYTRSSTGIHVTPADNLIHTEPALIPGPSNVGVLYVAPSGIFWSDGSRTQIQLSKHDGTAGPTVHKNVNAEITAFTGDGDEIWWTTLPTSDAGPATGELWTRKAAELSSFQHLGQLAPVRALSFDAEYIYLGFPTGEVKRFRRDGKGALELVTRVEGPRLYPRVIAVAGDSLFVAFGEVGSQTNGDFRLYRAKKCGGRAREIARGYMYGNRTLLTGKHLYYGDIGLLRRLDVSRWLP